MMRVADTSALYALFSEEVRFHQRVLEDMSAPDPVAIPSEILVETIDLLAYRFGPSAGKKALDSLLQLPHVSVAEKVELRAVKDIYDKAKGMSLADAFVVQTCVALGA
ncbi:MAG: PIN domain-containing protein, partial [Thermoplasmata archaeon]